MVNSFSKTYKNVTWYDLKYIFVKIVHVSKIISSRSVQTVLYIFKKYIFHAVQKQLVSSRHRFSLYDVEKKLIGCEKSARIFIPTKGQRFVVFFISTAATLYLCFI